MPQSLLTGFICVIQEMMTVEWLTLQAATQVALPGLGACARCHGLCLSRVR